MRSPPGFDATVIVTVPLALPFAPEAIAAQLLSLDAVQLQPVSVVMPTASCPPLYPIASLLLLSEYRHGAAA